MASEKCPFGSGFDFTDPDLLQQRVPVDELAYLRRTAPVWWNEQSETSAFGDTGYWVITRHADVMAISRNSEGQWSTHRNGVMMRLPEGVTADEIDAIKTLIINQDPPEHTRLRKLISQLFTQRSIARLEEHLALAARQIVQEASELDGGNFVEDIAMKLPAIAIADLIGAPQADRDKLYHWTNALMNHEDPDLTLNNDMMTANAELVGYAYSLAEKRRRCPADDIVSRLIQPDATGDTLEDTEFALFTVLLAVAGNETTRNAITHGMNAFLEHPNQWEIYKRERPATAVDEILRWSTPVHCMQRTATSDTEIGGITIHAGQRVGLFYSSANFDEEIFEEPFRFDIKRNPNPHLSFGGHGAHYCLGASLARMEIKLIFDAIADYMPTITKSAEPQRLRSGWINGIKSLHLSYSS